MTLDRVRHYALALAGVTEQPHHHRTSFRVGGKIFATALPNGESLNVFLPEEQRAAALDRNPAFVEERRWGRQSYLHVWLADAQPKVVNALLKQAWTQRAPVMARNSG